MELYAAAAVCNYCSAAALLCAAIGGQNGNKSLKKALLISVHVERQMSHVAIILFE